MHHYTIFSMHTTPRLLLLLLLPLVVVVLHEPAGRPPPPCHTELVYSFIAELPMSRVGHGELWSEI